MTFCDKRSDLAPEFQFPFRAQAYCDDFAVRGDGWFVITMKRDTAFAAGVFGNQTRDVVHIKVFVVCFVRNRRDYVVKRLVFRKGSGFMCGFAVAVLVISVVRNLSGTNGGKFGALANVRPVNTAKI